jgi:hypothetical protein
MTINHTIDDRTAWALVVLGLILISYARVIFGRNRGE